MQSTPFAIRKGTEKDLQEVFALIHELAIFEKAELELVNSVEQMKADAFGDQPIFQFLVAETQGRIAGVSVFYFRYSTWKGKCLYLEDLIVTESERGRGMGKALFESTVEMGRRYHCSRMNWQVLDWNVEAIEFYRNLGASFDSSWINGYLTL